MELLNATNLDRKSGIRGPKKMGEALRQPLVPAMTVPGERPGSQKRDLGHPLYLWQFCARRNMAGGSQIDDPVKRRIPQTDKGRHGILILVTSPLIPPSKRVLLLKPRGFCAGVVRAIDVVNIALDTFGAPIYVRKEIVHNRFVVNELAEKGAIFVDDIDDVPEGMRVIYSAHGVSPAVRARSKSRKLKVIDATCPLVTKVHVEAVKFARQGYSLVLIGHRDHDEIEGTLGEAPEVTQVVSTVEEVAALEVPDPERVAYLTQTTLSLDEARDIIHALKAKFPSIIGPHTQDICYATENRQVAVKNVAHKADLVLVVGSTNSSNSNRLVEVSRNLSTNAFLIEDSDAIDPAWLEDATTVAVTAGASAPEVLVAEVVAYLRGRGFSDVEEVEVMPENVRFGLPPEIVQAIRPVPVSG
jgi:4-hydroxy-3-methylbut-2-enyl diphosphate reductase